MPALAILALLLAGAQDARYEIVGRIEPPGRAAVQVWGATMPFSASTMTGSNGRFRVRKLVPGSYTLSVFLPGRGEARQTVPVGPGSADDRQRVHVTIAVDDARLQRDPRDGTVSARQLSIPQKARREYQEAVKLLAKPDVAGAVKRLERAVEIAPEFSEAWNNLGTIAYQSGQYQRAEECFRRALEADPNSYAPLVNLGGVLVTTVQLDEALKYNIYAVLSRPNDALANSQLGLTYFHLNRLDLAEKYLRTAIKLDPAHFSHPQLVLAEVYLRRNQRSAAADLLEHFLKHHPDVQSADKMREAIAKLRAEP